MRYARPLVVVLATVLAVVGLAACSESSPSPSPSSFEGFGPQESGSLLLAFAADDTIEQARYGTVELSQTFPDGFAVLTEATFDRERGYVLARETTSDGGSQEVRVIGGEAYVYANQLAAEALEIPADTWLQVSPVDGLAYPAQLGIFFSDWMAIPRATTGRAESTGPSGTGTGYTAEVNVAGVVGNRDNVLMFNLLGEAKRFPGEFVVSEDGVVTAMAGSNENFDLVLTNWAWTYQPTDTPPTIERPVGARAL